MLGKKTQISFWVIQTKQTDKQNQNNITEKKNQTNPQLKKKKTTTTSVSGMSLCTLNASFLFQPCLQHCPSTIEVGSFLCDSQAGETCLNYIRHHFQVQLLCEEFVFRVEPDTD